MKKYLYLEFNEIKISIYNNDFELLNKLRKIWGKTLSRCSIEEHVDKDVILKVYTESNSISKVTLKENEIVYRYDTRSPLIDLFHFIKECIVKLSLLNGYSWLHASAFEVNKKVVLVCGEKESGKTTTLLRAILFNGGFFIGNDQIPIKIINNKLHTFLFRPDIKIRNDTLKILGLSQSSKSNDYMTFIDNTINNIFDYEGFESITGKSVLPITLPDFRIPSVGAKEISKIIVIGNQEMNNVNNLLRDQETIQPEDINFWNLKKSYWRRFPDTIRSDNKNYLEEFFKNNSSLLETISTNQRNEVLKIINKEK